MLIHLVQHEFRGEMGNANKRIIVWNSIVCVNDGAPTDQVGRSAAAANAGRHLRLCRAEHAVYFSFKVDGQRATKGTLEKAGTTYVIEHRLCHAVSMSLTLNVAVVAEIFRSEIVRLCVEKLRVEELLTACHVTRLVTLTCCILKGPSVNSLSHGGLEGPSHFDIFPLEHFRNGTCQMGIRKKIKWQWLSRAESRVCLSLSRKKNSFQIFIPQLKNRETQWQRSENTYRHT